MNLVKGRTGVDIDEASDTTLGPDVITRMCYDILEGGQNS